MLTQSVLSEIMTFLNLPELLLMSQVNKRFYQACSSPMLYRREFLSNWMNSEYICNRACISWKSLCLKGIRNKRYWRDLSDCVFTSSEVEVLYAEIVQSLSRPFPTFPVFRRDVLSFPTVIQDLLANPEDQFEIDIEGQEYSDVIGKYFNDFSEDLYHQIGDNELVKIRWNAKGGNNKNRESIGSVDTQASYQDVSGSYLVRFFKGVKKCVKTFCQAVGLLVLESDSPIETYCNYWENFTYSIKSINSVFLPVTEMINEFYEMRYGKDSGPGINFVKVMAAIWREKVFETCKDLLTSKVLAEVQDLRGKNITYGYDISTKRLVESLLDISLNELNIFFKNHSLLTIEGPYKLLHQAVIGSLTEYYSAVCVDFSSEEGFLNMIFPVATVREAKRTYCSVIGTLTSNPALIAESQNYGKTEEDEAIEWKMSNFGISTSQEPIDMWRFSQCRESKLIDIINYLQTYSLSQMSL